MRRKKISYLRKMPGRVRRVRITYYQKPSPKKIKPIKEYHTPEANISKTGLRRYLSHRKGQFKRLKGKTKVDIKMAVINSKGKRIKDIKGLKGLVLGRTRKKWQKEIGDYIHSQLADYNLYIGNYLTVATAKKLKTKKARQVKISLKFSKI